MTYVVSSDCNIRGGKKVGGGLRGAGIDGGTLYRGVITKGCYIRYFEYYRLVYDFKYRKISENYRKIVVFR